MLAPETLMAGKYVIVRPLESGGMGDVYEAYQKDLSRPVAIKLLRAELMGDPAMFLRFRREAEAAASLGHPNIVQILDFLNDPGDQPMLVMEKLEGRSSVSSSPMRARSLRLVRSSSRCRSCRRSLRLTTPTSFIVT